MLLEDIGCRIIGHLAIPIARHARDDSRTCRLRSIVALEAVSALDGCINTRLTLDDCDFAAIPDGSR